MIYKISQHKIYKAKWLNETHDNGAWIYIGDKIEHSIVQSINQFLEDSSIYISSTRTESLEIPKELIERTITPLLGVHDFTLWNKAFTKVIEFNKNGVIRFGIQDLEENTQ